MCARKIPLDYRRHLEMQVSDCVVNCIFPSTSTLLNPMRPSSQNLVRKVLLGNNPTNLHIRVCFVPNSIKCRTFFAHFVSILVLFVSVIRWHARAFHGRWPNLLSTLFLTRSAKRLNIGDMQVYKQTNCSLCTKLRSSVSVFFVRNSFESTIKRPSRAGSTLQCDRRGRSQ